MLQCDGRRPTCNACDHKHTECTWTADPDAPPIVALKRKYEALKEQSQDLCNLVELLTGQSEDVAHDTLRWLRTNSDVSSALRHLREAQNDGETSEMEDGNILRMRADMRQGLALLSGRPDHQGQHQSTSPTLAASNSSSEIGSPAQSPCTTPRSASPRRVSIQDLLNHGCVSCQRLAREAIKLTPEVSGPHPQDIRPSALMVGATALTRYHHPA